MSCSTKSTVDAFGAHRLQHHLHDAELLLGGDAAGGLVEQQHARLRHHGERDVEQLAHAAGQHLRVALAVVGEAEALEQALGDLVARAPKPGTGAAPREK